MRRFYSSTDIEERVRFLEQQDRRLAAVADDVQRLPHFCSGCPHNTSTRVPEGSRAVGGIGCHYMAAWMDRDTVTFTQMGGEGATWIGQAPFTDTQHVFQNLGDGTYAHSGTLAIRAAVAAGVNMTYKILFNDAVAMTGGQPVEGHLTVAGVAQQLVGEGVQPIIVVTDEPKKYAGANGLPPSVTVHHRRELDRLQRELREVKGVSALIYDQTCAAELHRKRKRGTVPTPDRRVVINELVCEGCGDCNVQSNCLSVMALETEFGRKRRINQSSCNQDFSCLNGFCPSFVTLRGREAHYAAAARHGGRAELAGAAAGGARRRVQRADRRRRRHGRRSRRAACSASRRISKARSCTSSIKRGSRRSTAPCCRTCASRPTKDALHGMRIPAGQVDLLLGADLIVAADKEPLSMLAPDRSAVIVNTHEEMPSDFIRDRDFAFPGKRLVASLQSGGAAGRRRDARCHAARVGAARRQHRRERVDARICVSARVVTRVGRRALSCARAVRPQRRREQACVRLGQVRRRKPRRGRAARDGEGAQPVAASLPEAIARREEFLVGYQNRAYAERYRARLARLAAVEQRVRPGSQELADAVARNYFSVLAYKDEYEVARLHTETGFVESVKRNFGAGARMSFHFSPPLFARPDPATGRPKKYELGPWMLPILRVLAKLRWLRGTKLDPFGRSADRRLERELARSLRGLARSYRGRARRLAVRDRTRACALARAGSRLWAHQERRCGARTRGGAGSVGAVGRAGKKCVGGTRERSLIGERRQRVRRPASTAVAQRMQRSANAYASSRAIGIASPQSAQIPKVPFLI